MSADQRSPLQRSPEDLLADLGFQYLTRTPAAKAVHQYKRLEKQGHLGRLKRLLRHHSEFPDGTVEDADTRKRDGYDYLLAFYGLVEVACVLRLVPGPLPHQLAEQARRHLEDPAVRLYYEVNYRIMLPQLLRLRLRGVHSLVSATPNASIIFERFRMIGELIDTADRSLDRFLWLLDGGVVDEKEYDVDKLIEVLGKPGSLLPRLTRDPDKREDLDEALIGYFSFLQFAINLDELLQELEGDWISQAVLWHHHGYWFNALNTPSGLELRRFVETNRVWEGLSVLRDPRPAAALTRLCSGRYRWRLEEFISSSEE